MHSALLLEFVETSLFNVVSPQLDPETSCVVLTGPADMSEALGALALLLNGPDAAPPVGPPAPPAAPPAGDPLVNVTALQRIPDQQPEPNHMLVIQPSVVLNPQGSADVSVEAVRVATSSDKDTYHLILNDLQAGSVTRPGGHAEVRTLGGVINLSSDED